MAQAELSRRHALLRAVAELSREQTLLDQDPERTTAPRDHAMQKAVAAFREFEAGANGQKTARHHHPAHAQRQRISKLEGIALTRGAGRQ